MRWTLSLMFCVFLLAGCAAETEPPVSSTDTSAVVNAKYSCKQGEQGTRYIAYTTDASQPLGQWQKTPAQNWGPCSADASQDIQTTISGLSPNTTYSYAVCGTVSGLSNPGPYCDDSVSGSPWLVGGSGDPPANAVYDTVTTTPPPPPATTEGKVRPHRPLQSDMDATVNAALAGNATAKAFLERFESFRWWDGNTPAAQAYDQGWLNPGFTYRDAELASYVGKADNPLGEQAYLHDSNGNRLYIKYKCSGTTCSQYAGDVGNPALRQQYVNGLASGVARSGGVFMDDANFSLAESISNGSGTPTTPVDPRTGQLMTEAAWRGYMLQLVKDVKAAYPAARVVINTVYYHAGGALSKPEIMEALDVADGWEFERGFGDTGVVAGSGKYGFDTIKAVNDYVHAHGGFVIHDVQKNDLGHVYPEAAYLCFNDGGDYYFHIDMKPANAWDQLWDKDLGAATSACTKGSDGIYRRSFTNGSVTVNPSNKTGTIN